MKLLDSERTEASVRLWEYKDANLHRGIVEHSPTRQPAAASDVAQDIRATVANTFKPSWWRGFAFGSVIQLASSPSESLDVYGSFIDSFNNSKGVWQWVIAVDHQKNRAYACHMWLHGSLHANFQKTIDQLLAMGFDVKKEYRAKPRFFSRTESLLKKLGTAARTLRGIQVIIIIAAMFLIVGRAVLNRWN